MFRAECDRPAYTRTVTSPLWRVSIIRKHGRYLGTVTRRNEKAARRCRRSTINPADEQQQAGLKCGSGETGAKVKTGRTKKKSFKLRNLD